MAKSNAEKIASQVVDEHHAGFESKKGVYEGWHQIEDQYYGRVKKSLVNRFNVPFPFMSGFLDTFMAKIDDPFSLKFEKYEEAGYRTSMKVEALYEKCRRDQDADWESVDKDVKETGLHYGTGIYKSYSHSSPRFRSILEHVDVYDFYDQPNGGRILEDHRFCGQDNIFRDKYQLKEGVKDCKYNARQVELLINAVVSPNTTDKDSMYIEKQNRIAVLNQDFKTYRVSGHDMYKLIESVTYFEGKRWYIVWNRETGIWIQCDPLTDVFESNLYPWVKWHPKAKAYTSWPQGPAHDFLPVAVSMSVFLNQELDNRNKRNWNQRAFDPAVFPDPVELEWRPNGLVAVKSGLTQTQRIDSGIYTFETPELQGTINMVEYLNGMAGQTTGINAGAQGKADDEKVGIYFGNQQQVADRIEAVAKQYRKAQVAIGRRFVWGAHEHLNEPMAVKLLGEKGLEWDKLMGKEIDPMMEVYIVGGGDQVQSDEIKAKKRVAALQALSADPEVRAQVNPKWLAEQILTGAEYEGEEIRAAMDVKDYGNKEVLAKAAESIKLLLQGKKAEIFRGANTAFLQKILDESMKPGINAKQYDRLWSYGQAHIPIVMENTARMEVMERARQGATPQAPQEPGFGDMGAEAGQDAQMLPEGAPASVAASQSQNASEAMQPADMSKIMPRQ